jgi:hypothetical protein
VDGRTGENPAEKQIFRTKMLLLKMGVRVVYKCLPLPVCFSSAPLRVRPQPQKKQIAK